MYMKLCKYMDLKIVRCNFEGKKLVSCTVMMQSLAVQV